MSERTIDGGNFVAGTQQGDPEKLKYLHDANWQGKTRLGADRPLRVDARACPGCMFPDAPEGKWPHTNDARCRMFRRIETPDGLKLELPPLKGMMIRSDGSIV